MLMNQVRIHLALISKSEKVTPLWMVLLSGAVISSMWGSGKLLVKSFGVTFCD